MHLPALRLTEARGVHRTPYRGALELRGLERPLVWLVSTSHWRVRAYSHTVDGPWGIGGLVHCAPTLPGHVCSTACCWSSRGAREPAGPLWWGSCSRASTGPHQGRFPFACLYFLPLYFSHTWLEKTRCFPKMGISRQSRLCCGLNSQQMCMW